MKSTDSGHRYELDKISAAVSIAETTMNCEVQDQQDLVGQVTVEVLAALRRNPKLKMSRIRGIAMDIAQTFTDRNRLVSLPSSIQKALRQYSRVVELMEPYASPHSELFERAVIRQCFLHECRLACDIPTCPFKALPVKVLREVLTLCSTGPDNLESLAQSNGYRWGAWIRALEIIRADVTCTLDGLQDRAELLEDMSELVRLKQKCNQLDPKLFRLLVMNVESGNDPFGLPVGWASKRIKEDLGMSAAEIKVLLRKAKEAIG